jgi:subtilisin family serine protease
MGNPKIWAPFGMAALAVMIASAGGSESAKALTPSVQPRQPEHVPGEILVQLRSGGLRSQALVTQTLRQALGGVSIRSIQGLATDSQVQKIVLTRDEDMSRALGALKQNDAVRVAEPNWAVRALESGVPNDPEFGKLWGLRNQGQADAAGQVGTAGSDVNLLPLWQRGLTGSKNVVVAVIDTGIDWTHPDLVDNLYTNTSEVAGNGKDDDGNGFIDDIHGWNFNANTANSSDDHDHGTHCAGTIGAMGNNSQGVAGVNWNVTLMPVKFLSATGSGSSEGAINSINYARQMKVNIMSNSWGGGGFSQIMQDSITAARDQGILFVAAAGNDAADNDALASYPASYPVDNVVSVAASDNQDKIANFSNYGKSKVHVAAPGVRILSTTKGGKYAAFSGTSMATPHVAGIAALLMSADSTLRYSDLKERLIRTSTPVAGLKKKVIAKGRVNAWNALNNIIPPNDEPAENLWVDQPASAESEHPYKDKADQAVTLSFPGAKFIRVVFEKVETEKNYDKVLIQTPSGETIEEITGTLAGYRSDYVKGDSVVIRLRSDGSVNGWGYKVQKIQVVTSVSPAGER